jgi:hypothetical protein
MISIVITSSIQDSIKVYDRVSESDHANDGFWRITSGESGETCFLMTTTSAELIDFRVRCLIPAVWQPLILTDPGSRRRSILSEADVQLVYIHRL